MAMNGTLLGTAIKNMLKANGYLDAGISGADEAEVEQLWQDISTEIISHIVANGVVSTTVAPGIGVTTPDTINGTTITPGTGTGTIA